MLKLVLLLVVVAVCSQAQLSGIESLLQQIEADKAVFANDLMDSEFSGIAPELVFPTENSKSTSFRSDEEVLPLVFLHGMGDSCFNRGMGNIAKEAGKYMNVYSVCIPTGRDRIMDTLNGFIMSMNENVKTMADAVRNDTQLANGFNCIGLSQGNNICRGYIQQFNGVGGMPVAATHISIHGPVVGVASLPNCEINEDGETLKKSSLCEKVSAILGKVAYKERIQNFLFQANYFRQVKYINTTEYMENSQIAAWNNEGIPNNENENMNKIKINFSKTSRFAMIKANGDTVVVPREAEWFGSYDENYNLLTMRETPWYKDDMFGLKTADENGKLVFNSTNGNHLDFSVEELYGWLDAYAI